MRSAGNFSPEWGYLAPAPSFMRTARIVVVATAVGATAGAVVMLSLVDHPATQVSSDTAAAAHAIVTSAQAATPPVRHFEHGEYRGARERAGARANPGADAGVRQSATGRCHSIAAGAGNWRASTIPRRGEPFAGAAVAAERRGFDRGHAGDRHHAGRNAG